MKKQQRKGNGGVYNYNLKGNSRGKVTEMPIYVTQKNNSRGKVMEAFTIISQV
jgi:hypothetical protein